MYGRLVGKLNYHTVTKIGISFDVRFVSKFMTCPCDSLGSNCSYFATYKVISGKGLLFEDHFHEHIF